MSDNVSRSRVNNTDVTTYTANPPYYEGGDETLEAIAISLAQIVSNVKQPPYNAKGNGVDDDTLAFNNAISAVSALGGGKVLVPNGTYLIDATVSIQMKNNVWLEMSDGAVLSVIPNNQTHYNAIYIANLNNVKVSGGTIIGDRTNHIIVSASSDPNVSTYNYNGTGNPSLGSWGAGVYVSGSTDVLIEKVTAKNCWGDGFFVGDPSPIPNNNITLFECVADNNRRQGLSITNGITVNVINGRYVNTNGTAPQYGIDIEPDNSSMFIENINIIGVYTEGNVGGGIQFAPSLMAGSKRPYTVHVENYKSYNDGLQYGGAGLGFEIGSISTQMYGNITVKNATIINPGQMGVNFYQWGALSPHARLENVEVYNPASRSGALIDNMNASGIVLYINPADPDGSYGNIDFIHCKAIDNRATPLMVYTYLLYSPSTTKTIDNVNIIDPNGSGQTAPGGIVSWTRGSGVVRYTQMKSLNFSGTVSADSYAGIEMVFTTNSAVTLPSANDKIGREFIVRANTNAAVEVKTGSGDNFAFQGGSFNDIVLPDIGSFMKVKSIGNNQWIILEYGGRIYPFGYGLSSAPRIFRGSAPPTSGTYSQGDILSNSGATVGGIGFWECTSAGSPGAWTPKQVGTLNSIGSTPSFVGQIAVVSGIAYMATGTSATSDWKQITN